MAKKMTDEEIREFINSKSVTQNNYVAPTVRSNQVAPAMSVVASQPVQTTVKPTVKQAIKQYGDAIKNSAVKNHGFTLSNAITDLANLYDAKRNIATSIPGIGKVYDVGTKTAGNIATNMGIGATKSIEGAADALSDLYFNPRERMVNYVQDLVKGGKKLADENLKDLKEQQKRDIKKNMTEEFTRGYNEVLPEWEKNSLVRQNNFGGQVAQGVGGMVPSLILGGAYGANPQMTDLSNLAGREKLMAALGNVGNTYMAQLPANAMLGASSYGGGMEEALNQGASMNKARLRGLSNLAIEQGTEMLTGGVPGLEGRGGIDQFIDPLIGKTGGYLNPLLKAGYGALGEGLEESAAEYLDALARKGILGEDIDWKQVNKDALRSGLVGAATGAILNTPSNIQNFSEARQTKQVSKPVQETTSEPTQMTQEAQNVEERPINQEERKVPGEEALEPITQREENVDNSQQREYNEDVNEEGVRNDFRTIQEESRRMSTRDTEMYHSGERQVDEGVRNRLSTALSGELRAKSSSGGYGNTSLVNPKTNKTQNYYTGVDANTFHDNMEIVQKYLRNGDAVDVHDAADYKDTNNYLSEDGLSGFAITKDGDLISVFNMGEKGYLDTIAPEVQKNAKTLDCFQSDVQPLADMYEKKLGFKKAAEMDFNYDFLADQKGKEYADYFVKTYGEAPVVFMVKTDQDVPLKHFNKDQYEDAMNYRDSFKSDNAAEKINEPVIKAKEEGTSDSSFSDEQNEVKVLDKVPKQEKKPLKERLRETRKKLTRDFISKGEAIENLSRKQKNPNLNHLFDRLGITRGEAQEHIGSMQRDLNLKPRKNFIGADGKKTTMSLNGIREDAKNNGITESTLNRYLAEYRNVDTEKQGKPILNKSAENSMEVIKELESKHPELKRIADNVWTFEKNQLQDRVDSGLISQEFADELLKNNPHYVRIQRNVQGRNNTTTNSTNKGVAVNQQIDTLKGSDLDVMPIMESIAKYTEQVQQSMRMNQFGQELAKTLGVGSQDNSISSFTDEESFGVNPDLLQDDGNGNYTFTVFNKGKATVVPIDKGIYEALTPNKTVQTLENDETFKKITYAPKKMSEMFRTLTTDKNPVFMFTNAFRDIGDAPFNSKYTGEFLKTYASTEALRQVAGNGVYNQLYEAAGGKQNSYFNNGEFVDKTQSTASKVKDKLLMPIEKGNEIVESVPRMAEFIATIKANGYEVNADGELIVKNKNKVTKPANEVLNEALYNAAEVTTNFKRGGDVAKLLNRNGATFLNASIQGFDKQIRNFTQINNPKEAVMLLTKALIFGIAPTMLNDAMWDDDDEYEELQEYQKDNYYLFKGKDGQWIRIPKGRAMSVIGGAFRRGKSYLKGDKKAFEGFGSFAANQVAPNSVINNNIFAPLSQVKNNKSWSGNKIISDSMMKRPTEEQYNEKTDEISKFIGKAIKDLPLPEDMKNFKSPLAIHYLLDQYTGAIGDVILPMITEKSSSKYNPLIAPFISKFTADSVYSNKSVGEYYDKKNELEIKKNSSKSTPLDAAKSSYMTSRNNEIADLYKQQKQIQGDSSLSNEEKYDKAREKQKEINKKAKEIVKDVDKVDENEYYVKIGDYYYKKVMKYGEEKYVRDTSKKIPDGDKYALYDYFKAKYEKSKEES